MVRIGVGIEHQGLGEHSVPLYDSGSNGRTVLTANPFGITVGDFTIEPYIAVTSGDIAELYGRIRP